MNRGSLFRKSKRRCGRPPKCVTLLFSSIFHLPRYRHTTFDRGEQGEGDASRDDQFDEAVIWTSPGAQGSLGASSVDSRAGHRNSTVVVHTRRDVVQILDVSYVACSIDNQSSEVANLKFRTLLLYGGLDLAVDAEDSSSFATTTF